MTRLKIRQAESSTQGAFVSKRPLSVSVAAWDSYRQALSEAGVTSDDLKLLRDLAEANAAELDERLDPLPSARVLL